MKTTNAKLTADASRSLTCAEIHLRRIKDNPAVMALLTPAQIHAIDACAFATLAATTKVAGRRLRFMRLAGDAAEESSLAHLAIEHPEVAARLLARHQASVIERINAEESV